MHFSPAIGLRSIARQPRRGNLTAVARNVNAGSAFRPRSPSRRHL